MVCWKYWSHRVEIPCCLEYLMSGCWYMAFVYLIMAWAVTVAWGIHLATGAV